MSQSPNVQFHIRLRNTRRRYQHLDTKRLHLGATESVTDNTATEVDMVGKRALPCHDVSCNNYGLVITKFVRLKLSWTEIAKVNPPSPCKKTWQKTVETWHSCVGSLCHLTSITYDSAVLIKCSFPNSQISCLNHDSLLSVHDSARFIHDSDVLVRDSDVWVCDSDVLVDNPCVFVKHFCAFCHSDVSSLWWRCRASSKIRTSSIVPARRAGLKRGERQRVPSWSDENDEQRSAAASASARKVFLCLSCAELGMHRLWPPRHFFATAERNPRAWNRVVL